MSEEQGRRNGKPKVLLLVEARGAQFRPHGAGDYQPALYNVVQAVAIGNQLQKEGYDVRTRHIIDLGLSPEEYSPTQQFCNERTKDGVVDSEAIVRDMRERHAIVYGLNRKLLNGNKFDEQYPNSGTVRSVQEVRDGDDYDLSPREIEFARAMLGKPYHMFEVGWLRNFLLNHSVVSDIFEIPHEEARELLGGMSYATYPVRQHLGRSTELERAYIGAYLDLALGLQQEWVRRVREREPIGRSRKADKRTSKTAYKSVKRFLDAIGIRGERRDTIKDQFGIQLPVDGRLTSYFDVRTGLDGVIVKPQNRLGWKGEEIQMTYEEWVKRLGSESPYVTSYPLALAHQVIDNDLVRLHQRSSEITITPDAGITDVYLIAERADPKEPTWDAMHLAVADQLGNLFTRRTFDEEKTRPNLHVISYPADQIIDPDIDGRKIDPRDVAREIWKRIHQMDDFGVKITNVRN